MNAPAAPQRMWLPGLEAEQRRRDLSQFYTPADLAERFWAWMRHGHTRPHLRVLEPAAGRGALLNPITERPRFGGDFDPMTDFVLLELERRRHARKQGEPSTLNREYW